MIPFRDKHRTLYDNKNFLLTTVVLRYTRTPEYEYIMSIRCCLYLVSYVACSGPDKKLKRACMSRTIEWQRMDFVDIMIVFFDPKLNLLRKFHQKYCIQISGFSRRMGDTGHLIPGIRK